MRGVMASQERLVADADQALAEWAVHHDIAGGAVDQRNSAFKKFLSKLLFVGPTYILPTQQASPSCAPIPNPIPPHTTAHPIPPLTGAHGH